MINGMEMPGAALIAIALLLGALFVFLALRRHTDAVERLANRERTDRGETLVIDSDETWQGVVRQAVVETYGTCGAIVSHQHQHVGDAGCWMSFLGRSHRVYVISTSPLVHNHLPRARQLKGLAAAELSGELNAVWRHFAARKWRTSSIRRHQVWYVLETNIHALRAMAQPLEQLEAPARRTAI